MKVQNALLLVVLLFFSGLQAMESIAVPASGSSMQVYVDGARSEELRGMGIYHLVIPHQRQSMGREGAASSPGVIFTAADVAQLPQLERYLINSGCGFLASYSAINSCMLLHRDEHILYDAIVRSLCDKERLMTFFWDSYKELYGSDFSLSASYAASGDLATTLEPAVVRARSEFEQHLRDVVAIDYPINVGHDQIIKMLQKSKMKEGLTFLGKELDIAVCSDDQTQFTFLSDPTKSFNVDFDKASQAIKAYCADIQLGLKTGLILIAPDKAHVYDRSEGWHYLCLVIKRGVGGKLEMLVMEGMNEAHYTDFGTGSPLSMVEWVYKNHVKKINDRCSASYRIADDHEMLKFLDIASVGIKDKINIVFRPILMDMDELAINRMNSIFRLLGQTALDEFVISGFIDDCGEFLRNNIRAFLERIKHDKDLELDRQAMFLYVALYSLELETILPFCPVCHKLEQTENPLICVPCGMRSYGRIVNHIVCMSCLKGTLNHIEFNPFNGRSYVKCFSCKYIYDAAFAAECDRPGFVRANDIFSGKLPDSGSESVDVSTYVGRMHNWRKESVINPYEEAEMCAVGHTEDALKRITSAVKTGAVAGPVEDLYLEFLTRASFFNTVELCQLPGTQPEQHFEVGQISAIIKKEVREAQPELAAMGDRLAQLLRSGASPVEQTQIRKHITLLLWQGIGWRLLNKLLDSIMGVRFVDKLRILNSALYNKDYGLGEMRSNEDFSVIKNRTVLLRRVIERLVPGLPSRLEVLSNVDFERRVEDAIAFVKDSVRLRELRSVPGTSED